MSSAVAPTVPSVPSVPPAAPRPDFWGRFWPERHCGPQVAILAAAALTLVRRVAIAIGLRLTATRLALRLLLARLTFLATLAPTLVVALDEAAHGLDHSEIVVGVLPIGLGQDPVTRGCCLACQCLVLVEDLVRVAADPHIGAAAVEYLVSIGRAVGIVMLLVMMTATAAATTATAARPLTIVWSH